MTSTNDIYQEVTDKIVTALENGTAPWLRPWKSGIGTALVPHNAVTGRAYNGINWLVLSCASYTSTGWLTYKQAQELGGNVRKGEKGTRIVFWSFPKMEDKETGKESLILTNARAWTLPSLRRSPLPLLEKALSMTLQRDTMSALIMAGTKLSFRLCRIQSGCLAPMLSQPLHTMLQP